MEERKEPRQTFVLLRGIYNKYGDKVGAGVPAALPPLPTDVSNNRLGFARWLVDKRNPLTARVTVNRFWQLFFGTGLVKTTEDFGAQGEQPSHPELLDWLAVEFMKDWNVQRLLRLIVTSATYRQASTVSPPALEKAPGQPLANARPALTAQSFWAARPGVAPEQFACRKGGWSAGASLPAAGALGRFQFQPDSLYAGQGRKSLPPKSVHVLAAFDQSSQYVRQFRAQVCTVRQSRTNTPLHALILLNDVTFVEAAHVWAQGVMATGGKTPEQRLNLAFRMATARPPTAAEQRVLVAGFHRVRDQLLSDRGAAEKLVRIGKAPRPLGLDVSELAAYTAVMNMILNLDEVITKE